MQRTAALIHEGAQTAKAIGPVIIRIQNIGTGYRLITEYASTGAQIEKLTKSYPTESGARNGANGLYLRFRDGMSVEQVIKATSTVPPMPTAAPTKPLMSDAQYDCLTRVEAAGTSEVIRFDDCNITTLYALAKRGLVADITFVWVERTNRRTGRKKLVRVVTGATVTARGWRDLNAERTRRANVRVLNEQIERATGVTR